MYAHIMWGETTYLAKGELLSLFRDIRMKVIVYREMPLNDKETIAAIIAQKVE
jgi:hypothetical protein